MNQAALGEAAGGTGRERTDLSESTPRPVAVIGADSPIGLTVVRELGRHGVPVIAVGRSERALGRFSRYSRQFICNSAPLAQWLPAFSAEHDLAAVLAISENQLLQLAELKGRLGDCKVLCPDPDKLAMVLDKQRTLDLAASLGIDVPSSWQPQPGEDFAAAAADLAYPVAVKWADPNAVAARLTELGLELEKVEYAESAPGLLAILSRYDGLATWPLVQTWCPGRGLGQMLHMHGGKATLRFQHRRLREWPPSGGTSTFCAAEPAEAHAAQMALSERLLQAMGWEGPAMVEYRHDQATGRYWLMEINGRFWGSIPLAYHCGVHFGWETVRCGALGGTALPQQPWKLRRARYLIPDTKHVAAVLRDRALRLSMKLGRLLVFLADFLDPRVRWFVWSWHDPGPFFGDLAGVVRKVLRRGS